MTTVEELMKESGLRLKVMAIEWGVPYAMSKRKRELAEGIVEMMKYFAAPLKMEKKKQKYSKCEHGKKKGFCMVCDDRYFVMANKSIFAEIVAAHRFVNTIM